MQRLRTKLIGFTRAKFRPNLFIRFFMLKMLQRFFFWYHTFLYITHKHTFYHYFNPRKKKVIGTNSFLTLLPWRFYIPPGAWRQDFFFYVCLWLLTWKKIFGFFFCLFPKHSGRKFKDFISSFPMVNVEYFWTRTFFMFKLLNVPPTTFF